MVLGKVEYSHHAGHDTAGDWAAKIVLTRAGGEPKFLEVNIIVVSRFRLGDFPDSLPNIFILTLPLRILRLMSEPWH